MPPNSQQNGTFQMRSNFKLQDQPRRQWKVIQVFGENKGGQNGGIVKVELKNDPYDRYFIEKRYNQQQALDPYFTEREITLLYQLQDRPNVTKYVDHYLDRKARKASVYMEYCDAGDLEDVIRAVRTNRPVQERQVWKWFIGCMDALSYCHYGPKPDDVVFRRKYWNQIYHRDIKPGNILLKVDAQQREIVAKVADFGCSVSDQWTKLNKSHQQASRTSAYTPGYESPDYPDFSVLTDVWQMALCIASVCTGNRNPRSRYNATGDYWDRQQPAGRQFTKELNDVLNWCLTDEKQKRPDSLTVLKRLKETYKRLDGRLPIIDQPTNVYWQSDAGRQTIQAPPPFYPPGPRAGEMPGEVPYRRPRPPVHAFSDPGERVNQVLNPFQAFGQGQRTPMSPNAIDQIVQDGGGYPQPGLPGGFSPGYGAMPPGFGQNSYFGSRPGQYNARRR